MCADDRNPLYATGTPRPSAGAPSRGGPRSSTHSDSRFRVDLFERVSAIDAWNLLLRRRGRDSNPRGFRLPLFESGTINHSDTSPHRSLTFECVSPARIPTLAFEALGTNY